MQSIHLPKPFLATTFSLLLTLGSFALPSLANDNKDIEFGLPGRRISGGVRSGNCFTDFDQSLVALIPHSLLGKTAEARPTFWFSIPETINHRNAAFELADADGNIAYSSQIEAGNEKGVSEFKLPDNVPELDVDKNYKWTFSISCTNNSSFVVQGWVRRVAMTDSMASQISVASPIERVALYKSAGLWHEQVTTLVNLRRNNLADTSLQLEWDALIQSAGLTSEVASDFSNAMSVVEPSISQLY